MRKFQPLENLRGRPARRAWKGTAMTRSLAVVLAGSALLTASAAEIHNAALRVGYDEAAGTLSVQTAAGLPFLRQGTFRAGPGKATVGAGSLAT